MFSFIDSLLGWLPMAFSLFVYGLVVVFYLFKKSLDGKKTLANTLFIVTISVVVFRLFYTVIVSLVQYYVWKSGDFGKLLLPPYQTIGYFLGYSWRRFWLGFMLSLVTSLLFLLFLKLLGKYRANFFEQDEIGLLCLMSFLVGWPNIVIFIPLVFVISAIFSTFMALAFRKQVVRLRVPVFLSSLFLLIWGHGLVDILSLTVLRV